MKIGIMSMQRIINYGSFLQAWGLKYTLKSLGYAVEFVDYSVEPPIGKNTVQCEQEKPLLLRLTRLLKSSYRKRRGREVKVNKIYGEFQKAFQEHYLPLLCITEARNIRPELDVLIIGSDEVFNCFQSNEEVGYSLELFGKGNRAKKLLSYAASFGTTTIEKIYRFGKAEELRGLLDKEEEAAAARKFAHQRNKKLISLGFWQSCCDDYVKASPFEVLAYFSNADYVITDTFHGTVLSIKYNRPFISFVRNSNSEKMNDLLSRFGLESRISKDPKMIEEIIEQDMDYSQVNQTIHRYREEAISYLQSVISEIS